MAAFLLPESNSKELLMIGEAHWITLILLGLSAAGILLLFFFKFRLDQRFRSVVRRVRCPDSWRRIEQTVIQDAHTGGLTGVVSCSEFANPTAVTCDRECIKARQPTAATVKTFAPVTRVQ